MTLLAALDGEFDGLAGHFLAHEGPVAAEITGIGEAVAAPQVAVVGHMQAQGFQHRFVGEGIRHREVRGEQQPGLLQVLQFVHGFVDVLFGIFPGKVCLGLFHVLAVVKAQQIINHGVDDVYGAAVHVQDHIVVVQMHSMDQQNYPPFCYKLQENGSPLMQGASIA